MNWFGGYSGKQGHKGGIKNDEREPRRDGSSGHKDCGYS